MEVAWPHNGDRLFRRNAIKQRLRSSFARQEKKGGGGAGPSKSNFPPGGGKGKIWEMEVGRTELEEGKNPLLGSKTLT